MKRPSMKLIALGMFTAAIASCVGCSTISKAYWDHQVKELCEKDGGVTIFEKVEILKADYPNIRLTQNGKVIIPNEDKANFSSPFFIRFERQMFHEDGNLKVSKGITSIIKRSDNKVLSTWVTYSRSGGDPAIFNGVAMPSHYSCENQAKDINIFESTVVVKGE